MSLKTLLALKREIREEQLARGIPCTGRIMSIPQATRYLQDLRAGKITAPKAEPKPAPRAATTPTTSPVPTSVPQPPPNTRVSALNKAIDAEIQAHAALLESVNRHDLVEAAAVAGELAQLRAQGADPSLMAQLEALRKAKTELKGRERTVAAWSSIKSDLTPEEVKMNAAYKARYGGKQSR